MTYAPPNQDAKAFLENAVYFVEGDYFAHLSLYREYAINRQGFPWESQSPPGLMTQIGSLEGRPVMIQLTKSRILGQFVCFWEISSQVADYKMAKDWLEEVRPDLKNTDAMNFSHCVNHLLKMTGDSIENYPRIWDPFRKKIMTPPPKRTSSSQTFKAVTGE
jgi:hypothetical protein